MNFIGEYQIEPVIAKSLVQLFHKYRHLAKPGIVGDDSVSPDRKDSEDLTLMGDIGFEEGVREYYTALRKCIDAYKLEYEFSAAGQADWGMYEFPNIQYYAPGGGFKVWHYEKTGINSKIVRRHLVFMTYLCDIPLSDGGGTEFLYQNAKYECKTGSTLIWPAEWTHTHRGIVSNTCEKMIITGWYSYTNTDS